MALVRDDGTPMTAEEEVAYWEEWRRKQQARRAAEAFIRKGEELGIRPHVLTKIRQMLRYELEFHIPRHRECGFRHVRPTEPCRVRGELVRLDRIEPKAIGGYTATVSMETVPAVDIADRIRAARGRGYSRQRLGELTGLGSHPIWRWENGRGHADEFDALITVLDKIEDDDQ